MEEYIIYLIKASICTGLFYAVYRLLLSRETFFSANRMYLIFSLIASCLIPSITFTAGNSPNEMTTAVVHSVSVTMIEVEAAVSEQISAIDYMLEIYLIGLLAALIILVIRHFRLISLSRKFGTIKINGLSVVPIKGNYSSFSYMNKIYIHESDLESDYSKKIIEHERVHINKQHSFDLILLEVLGIIFWFNPILRLYRSALKTVHEFSVDRELVRSDSDSVEYSSLLLAEAFGDKSLSFVNNFNNSTIKRRLVMMSKAKSGLLGKIKYLIILPVCAFLITAFSYASDKVTNSDTTEIITPNNTEIDSPQAPAKADEKAKKADEKAMKADMEAAKADIEAAKADMETAKADIEASKADMEAARADIEASKADVEAARADIEASRADVEAARADIEAARVDIEAAKVDVEIAQKDIILASKSDKKVKIIKCKEGEIIKPAFEYPPTFDMKELSKNVKYPETAKKKGFSGKVVVQVTIAESGKIMGTKVVSSTEEELNEAAIKAIKLTEFKPARDKNKKPVKCTIAIPISFKLK